MSLIGNHANTTILPSMIIAENAMVGVGALVIDSVPTNADVVENPARITRFIET